MPSAGKTAQDLDRDLKLLVADRRRYLSQIEAHLKSISELRTSYARAGDRVDAVLDERTQITITTPAT